MAQTIPHDYFIVEVDQLYEKQITKAGIHTLNDAWIEDGERFRFQYKRIWGTVVNIPRGYTETAVFAHDPGAPNYKLFCGHDQIQKMVMEGYPDWTRETHYHPGLVDKYDLVTLREYGAKNTVKIGDRVYFNPVVTEEENFLKGSAFRKSAQFKIRVDHIFCCVRDGVIIPQGGYILVEPNMETWEDITRPSGIIVKTKPEAKYLEGIVRFADSEIVKAGQYIYYITDADWPHMIEGTKYFVMREDELLCEMEQELMFPTTGSGPGGIVQKGDTFQF